MHPFDHAWPSAASVSEPVAVHLDGADHPYRNIMTKQVRFCEPTDSLELATGTGRGERTVGIITDREIGMCCGRPEAVRLAMLIVDNPDVRPARQSAQRRPGELLAPPAAVFTASSESREPP